MWNKIEERIENADINQTYNEVFSIFDKKILFKLNNKYNSMENNIGILNSKIF